MDTLMCIPKVIYHEEYNLYQIPYLHVEMPSDGSSIKGLAHGILQKLDELIPGADYYSQYALKGKAGADTIMRSVARLMNLHLVGLHICDEVQNLTNATKGGHPPETFLGHVVGEGAYQGVQDNRLELDISTLEDRRTL